jgi:transcription initiation factor TFIIE subunit alpha
VIANITCADCRYSAFDALQLISYTDDMFHCERCDGELVAESDKLAADEMGDGDDNRSRRREKLKDLLQRIEVSLCCLFSYLIFVVKLDIIEVRLFFICNYK